MIIKKRQLLLATLIIALGAAVFINWYYTKPTAKSAGTKPEQTTQQAEQGANLGDARYVLSSDVTLDDASAQAQASEYFAGAKLRRQTVHDEAAKAYGDIIKNSSSSSEAVKAAESALKELTDALTKESDIENLIAAKVGCENLVIINGGTVEIIVENGSLDDVSLIKIKEIAVKQTGFDVDKIAITEMEY